MYIFQAALLCDDCGEKKRADVRAAHPDLSDDDANADTDECPVWYDEDSSETDSLSMCDGGCGELILEQLTTDGRRDLATSFGEMLAGDAPKHPTVREYWRQVLEHYGDAIMEEAEGRVG